MTRRVRISAQIWSPQPVKSLVRELHALQAARRVTSQVTRCRQRSTEGSTLRLRLLIAIPSLMLRRALGLATRSTGIRTLGRTRPIGIRKPTFPMIRNSRRLHQWVSRLLS